MKIEDFEAGPVLGEGSFGTVTQYTHLESGEIRAIKSVDIVRSRFRLAASFASARPFPSVLDPLRCRQSASATASSK
jgi:hypothetical protein